MISEYLWRFCAVCGREIEVKILRANRLIISGGFYYGSHLLDGRITEYWECHWCRANTDHPATRGFTLKETYLENRKSK